MSTQFAPAERGDKELLKEQASFFLEDLLLIRVLDAVTTPVLILNSHRQIVYANNSFLDLIGVKDPSKISGLRPGEAIGCIHSDGNEGGCGTTEFCSKCGAARAILSSIQGDIDVQECRISLNEDSGALDLRIMAVPIQQKGEWFTVFSITNIADEKRRDILERIFLHDLSNTAGGIHGLIRLFSNATGEQEELYRSMIYDLSDKLLDEIKAHRQLIDAENNRLDVNPEQLNSIELLERIIKIYSHHDVAKDKQVLIDRHAENITFTSDGTILSRVIGNMTKNALEAVGQGKVVTLSGKKEGDKIEFSVHNPGLIPREAQLQIFQRSFSTKGSGRGLGTYSIKLLSEQYLNGEVGFSTSDQDGTIFYGTYPLKLNNK